MLCGVFECSAGILPAIPRAFRPRQAGETQAARPTAAETAALPVLVALLTLFPRVSSKDSVSLQVRSVKQNYLADDGQSLRLTLFAQGLPVTPSKNKLRRIPVYKRHAPVVFGLVLLLVASTAFAQSTQLNLPRDSQRASVTQRIGITDITVKYHRPLVKGRTIWGKVVPYGQVWRAGANENTTITFTDPVSIEGKPLDKGTYGLHMIPNEDHWTVIFSKMSDAWGSFTYDQKEDALRVDVKPQTTDMHDALTYDFDDLKADSAVLTLRWEKVAVP